MTTISPAAHIVQAPLFPTYEDLGYVVRAFDGEPVRRVRDTIGAIWEQTGTPQNPVDWSDPDAWIKDRLSGECQALAQKIWTLSGGSCNPRYMYGSYLFVNREKLLDQENGIYQLGERGRKFLAGDETVLRELDAAEGIPKLLSLVAERSPCRRADILPAWSDYLKAVSLFKTPKTFSDTMRRRVVNIAERGFIAREGNSYSITDPGLKWLKGFDSMPRGRATPAPSKRTVVIEAARAHNDEEMKSFKARLMALEPAQFEHFVKELLDAMDYEDVRVTKISGDLGVDVVAKVQFGITEITEVVQVKRREGSISRPTVDQLRGALPYHKLVRSREAISVSEEPSVFACEP